MCGTFPGRDRHPHGLAGHLASTGGRAPPLIIAFGIITRPYHLLIVEAAVAILVLQALIINRLAGIEYPVWAAAARDGQRDPVAEGAEEGE